MLGMPPLRDLFFQRDAIRRSVIASYWLAIILALPLWWNTTTIYRLSLPSSRVEAIARNKLLLPISICLVTNDHSLPGKLHHHLVRSTDYWKVLDVHIFGDLDCSSLGMFYCVVIIRY
jgi:phosphatidylinositol glycan class S